MLALMHADLGEGMAATWWADAHDRQHGLPHPTAYDQRCMPIWAKE